MSAAAAPLDLADRFAIAIGGLLRALAHRASIDRSSSALMVLVWKRINRTRQRFAALLARYRAGTLRPARPYRPAPGRRPPPRPAIPVPRRFAWLSGSVAETRVYGGFLRQMLDDPEMAGLLAAAPQAGRMLRPLCRMLGVTPTPAMRATPRKPPAPSPARQRPARPKPARPKPAASPSAPRPRPVRAEPHAESAPRGGQYLPAWVPRLRPG